MGGTSSSRQLKEKKAFWKTPSGVQKYLRCFSSKEKGHYAEHEILGVKSSEKGIQSLPAEIQLLIFSYLTCEDLCKSVAPVSKYWYDLSKDPSLWLHLSLELSTWDTTAHIRSRCIFLRNLDIDGRNEDTIYDRRVLDSDCPFPQLTALKIKFAMFSGVFIANLSSTSPLLESLTLVCCKYIETKLAPKRGWTYRLSQLMNLNHLEINFTTCDLTDVDVDVIVSTCLNLQSLILDSVLVSNQNLQNIALNLKDKIQVISFSVTLVTVEGFAALASCVYLKKITFRFAVSIDDTVLDALRNLPLQELYIFFYPHYPGVQRVTVVSTECFVRFFTNPQRVLLKKVLFDNFLQFDDTVILSIANNCHQLVDLAFPRCEKVTDEGLVVLLQRSAKLERLNVTDTKITQDIIEPFGINAYTSPRHIQQRIYKY